MLCVRSATPHAACVCSVSQERSLELVLLCALHGCTAIALVEQLGAQLAASGDMRSAVVAYAHSVVDDASHADTWLALVAVRYACRAASSLQPHASRFRFVLT